MADLGRAYVQIVPKAQGISAQISNLITPGSKAAGTKAGGEAGAGFASGIKKAVAGLAIGGTIAAGFKAALDEGGKLEQSFGGLDTIYGAASNTMKQFAMQAASAGISANSYAEQAVSMGASLKQAFGGDAYKSMKAADMAIMDMTDNAAKMGTPIENIQNAYQGFAKSNYTMLDNLKLGYGGTKSEMERLLSDAEKLTGVKYDISNLGDVYSAIHAIQGDLGLTGVAAQEASETFSGSFNAMVASAKNFAGAIATGDGVGKAVNDLVKRTGAFLFNNFIPMVGRVVTALPGAISTALRAAIPTIASEGPKLITSLLSGITSAGASVASGVSGIISTIGTFITEQLPELSEKGGEMLSSIVSGILTKIPEMISTAASIGQTFITGLIGAIPALIESAGNLASGIITGIQTAWGVLKPQLITFVTQTAPEMMQKLASGIQQNLPGLIAKAKTIITGIVTAIRNNLPQLISKGAEIVNKIGTAIIAAIPQLASAAASMIGKLADFIATNLPTLAQKGGEIVQGLAKTLTEKAPELAAKAASMFATLSSTLAGAAAKIVVAVGKALVKIGPVAVKAAATLIKSLARGIASGLGPVKTAVNNIVTKIADTLKKVIDKVKSIGNKIKTALSNAFSSIRTKASAQWNKIKEAITKPIDSAKSTVSGIVDKIRGFFPINIGNIMSGFKTPHISLNTASTTVLGKTITYPTGFSVAWYKKAMNQPYMFGDATLFGAGEAGDEIMYGRQNLMNDIRDAVDGGAGTTNNFYITVDGAEAPEDYARRLVRQLKLETRTA